jgi:hypothetical protein
MHLDDVPDGTYHLSVHATNATGDGPESVPSPMAGISTNCPPPPAPTVTAVSPATGPHGGGTVVTVTGSGFTGVMSISFGGVLTPVSVTSDTSLEVTSPGGTGTVDVVVPGLGGPSQVSADDQFTYVPDVNVPNAPPKPTVPAIDCHTAAVFFTPPVDNGTGPILSYTATSNDGHTGVVDVPPFTIPITVLGLSPLGTYTFTVHASNAAGPGPESPPSNSVTGTQCGIT